MLPNTRWFSLDSHQPDGAGEKDVSASTKLIDRLKDMKLQGFWRGALKLYENSHGPGRTSRWQSFHYQILAELLIESHQFESLLRVWKYMKAHHFLAIDEQSANSLLSRMGRSRPPAAQADLAEKITLDVLEFMNEHSMKLGPSAARAAMFALSRNGSWEAAIGLYQAYPGALKPKSEVSPPGTPPLPAVPFPTQTPASPAETLVELNQLLAAMRDENSIRAVLRVMEKAGIEPDTNSVSSLIAAVPSGRWEECTALYHFSMGNHAQSTIGPRLDNALLQCLVRQRQWGLADQLYDSLKERAARNLVRPNARTLDLLTTMYDRRGSWQRVLEVTEEFKRNFPEVGPSNTAGAEVVKALSKAGKPDMVLDQFEQMRAKGLKGSIESDVALINAWSSRELRNKRARRF